MHYYFVSIQYYHKGNIITFSTTFKSMEYLTKVEIIENAFLKEVTEHYYLGLNGLYDTIHDSKTRIIAYSNLTKQQYEQYKIIKNIDV